MKEKRTSEFVGSIIAAIFGLIIVNSMMQWREYTHGVVLESWKVILWATNLSMIVQILGNIILTVYRPARFYSFVQMIIAAAGLLSAVVFYSIFPLDFGQISLGWLNSVFKIMTLIGIGGTAIAIIVYFVRLVIGTQYKPAVEN